MGAGGTAPPDDVAASSEATDVESIDVESIDVEPTDVAASPAVESADTGSR